MPIHKNCAISVMLDMKFTQHFGLLHCLYPHDYVDGDINQNVKELFPNKNERTFFNLSRFRVCCEIFNRNIATNLELASSISRQFSTQSCGIPLTVKHILVECANSQDIREKYLTVSSLADLFNRVDNHSVIDFCQGSPFLPPTVIFVSLILYQLYSLDFKLYFYHLLVII